MLWYNPEFNKLEWINTREFDKDFIKYGWIEITNIYEEEYQDG